MVNTIQQTSSVESDNKNSPHSLGLNINSNRSSHHLSTNGVSSFSGKTGPSVIQGTVEVLTSFMQELRNSGKTDSELWKNCEARWSQLFSLVERQCQEQIAAQQEQFHNQIQRIQEEIKNLVKLQTSSASWVSCERSSSSNRASSGSQMGFFSESSERNESVVSSPKSKEPDCNVDSSSVSSGYGTFCVSELNTDKSKDAQEVMEHPDVSKAQYGAPDLQTDSLVGGMKSKKCYLQTTREFCDSLKEECSIFPGEFEHNFLEENKISEVYSGKTNSKSITSWAQKLKQNQPKRAHVEEGCSRSKRGSEHSKKLPVEKSDFAAVPHACAFYLNKPDESPTAWVSDSGTGLTYWKLEEKDLYHSLPDTLEKTFVPTPSTDLSPRQVLTLDSALPMKPSPQVSGAQPQDFLNALEDRISFSPDSVLEPSVSSHSDIDSFSQASNIAPGFPKYPSKTKASPVDSWKNHAFQNESRSSSTFPSVYTVASNDLSVNTVDEENTVLVASASVSQSQLPGSGRP